MLRTDCGERFQAEVTLFHLTIGPYCKTCLANGRDGKDGSSRQDDLAGTLEADPAWGIQIEALLRLTTSTIGRTFGHACSSTGELQKFPRCLADLAKVLRRQQRHVVQMDSGREPKIVVKRASEICSVCGHRKKDQPLTGDNVSPPGTPLGDGMKNRVERSVPYGLV